MTRVISVVSGKGGVGKTTLTANLGVELANHGHDVLLIDGNFSGANMSQHFGLGFQGTSLNDVLNGEAYITQAVSKHPEGVSILPASVMEFSASQENLKHSIVEFLGTKDFVLVDAAAGTDDEVQAAIETSDEVLLVAHPELPSLTNCLGAKKLAEQLEKDVLGVALNMVRDEKNEVKEQDVEELLEEEIIGKVPDHRDVREGIALRKPVVSHKPKSDVSWRIKELAHELKDEKVPQRPLKYRIKSKARNISLI